MDMGDDVGLHLAVASLRISHEAVAVDICGNVCLPRGLRNESLEISLGMKHEYLATC